MKSHIWLILLCSYRKPFRYQRTPKITLLYFILNFLLENLPMLRTRFCCRIVSFAYRPRSIQTTQYVVVLNLVRNMGKVSNRKFNMKYNNTIFGLLWYLKGFLYEHKRISQIWLFTAMQPF